MEPRPRTAIDYQAGNVEDVLAFLKLTRYQFRALRVIRVGADSLQAQDVNGDQFEVRGLGYLCADIIPVLNALNAVYRPELIHEPTDQLYKEFKAGRRYPWAADRVM